MRIGWCPLLGNTVIDSEVLDLCERSAMALGDLGATVEPMDDDLEPVEPIWFAYASALWNARFRDALPEWGNRLSPTLVRQMELGKNTTGEAVGRALLGRTQLFRKVQSWFERYDVIVTPTLALTPVPIGWQETPGGATEQLLRNAAFTPFTAIVNLTGQPAMSLPLHWTEDGLPVGVQAIGPPAGEALLLRLAAQVEAARPWRDRRPPLA